MEKLLKDLESVLEVIYTILELILDMNHFQVVCQCLCLFQSLEVGLLLLHHLFLRPLLEVGLVQLLFLVHGQALHPDLGQALLQLPVHGQVRLQFQVQLILPQDQRIQLQPPDLGELQHLVSLHLQDTELCHLQQVIQPQEVMLLQSQFQLQLMLNHTTDIIMVIMLMYSNLNTLERITLILSILTITHTP